MGTYGSKVRRKIRSQMSNTEQPITMENNKPPAGKVGRGTVDDETDEETTKNRIQKLKKSREEPEQSLAFESASGETLRMHLTDAENSSLKYDTTGDSWIGVQDNAEKNG